MKKGQKLSKNGYQLLGFPMEYMNITQGNNGQYSHQGVNALDLAGKDAGIDETIAPCDMDYKWNDSATNGNAIFFQSSNKVMFADGTVDYATFMFIHDNYIGDIIAHGAHFVQGETFGDEGTAGRATGNHCHFEVAKGTYTHPYDRNSLGVYHLPNSISADKCCVTDGTILYNGGQTQGSGNRMSWKTSAQIGGKSSSSNPLKELIAEDGVATLKFDSIRARKNGPNGDIVRTYSSGNKITYHWKYVGNGHRYVVWKEGKDYIFLAISNSETQGVEVWATFSEIVPEKKTEEKKVEVKQETKASSFSDDPNDDNFLEESELKDEILETDKIKLIHSLAPKSLYPKKCPYTMKQPKGVVIHNAGTNNNPCAANLNNSMLATSEEKSWHFSVDEEEAVEGLPINRNSWQAGDGGQGDGNRNYISIEICRDMDNDERWNQSKENGALLAAILLNKYRWGVDHLKKTPGFQNDEWKLQVLSA